MNSQSPKNRLIQTEKSQEQELSAATSSQSGREFASVEELLRHDAAQVQPPSSVWERLKRNLGESAAGKPSWWRRWFSR